MNTNFQRYLSYKRRKIFEACFVVVEELYKYFFEYSREWENWVLCM